MGLKFAAHLFTIIYYNSLEIQLRKVGVFYHFKLYRLFWLYENVNYKIPLTSAIDYLSGKVHQCPWKGVSAMVAFLCGLNWNLVAALPSQRWGIILKPLTCFSLQSVLCLLKLCVVIGTWYKEKPLQRGHSQIYKWIWNLLSGFMFEWGSSRGDFP